MNIPIMKPFFDQDEQQEIAKALESGWVAQGPRVAEFEKAVAGHEGVKHGVATTSCTTALHLAYVASGIGPGMDVILPSYTFVATANAVEMTGATPVLCDVRTDTYNLCIESLEKTLEGYTAKGINKKTGNTLKAIVAVHLFGLCADIHAINDIAARYGAIVIEDSACALGAAVGATKEGSFGNTSCLSFHPRKSITTGEGGMVLTNDDGLAEHMRQLRSHAASVSETDRHKQRGFLLPEYNEVGFNYRMTDVQAAMGLAQMKKFDFILEQKNRLANRYNELLQDINFLSIPAVPQGFTHTYQSYVTMLQPQSNESIAAANERRNVLMGRLEDMGIATRQGTHAVHMLGAYAKKYGYKYEDLPGAYSCDRLSIALPLYASMTAEEQDYVLRCLKESSGGIV